MRDVEMSTSQQFNGRWLVYYVNGGRVEIQGLQSKEQAIEYITTKPSGEFGSFVYVETSSTDGCAENVLNVDFAKKRTT